MASADRFIFYSPRWKPRWCAFVRYGLLIRLVWVVWDALWHRMPTGFQVWGKLRRVVFGRSVPPSKTHDTKDSKTERKRKTKKKDQQRNIPQPLLPRDTSWSLKPYLVNYRQLSARQALTNNIITTLEPHLFLFTHTCSTPEPNISARFGCRHGKADEKSCTYCTRWKENKRWLCQLTLARSPFSKSAGRVRNLEGQWPRLVNHCMIN